MNSISLCKYACGDRQIRKRFGGIFPSDSLPRHKQRFTSFIMNLDPKHLPGIHWVAVYFKGDTALFFNSYGKPPSRRDILHFLKRNCKQIKWNTLQFQNFYTTSCGQFCLFFLFRTCRNLDITDLSASNRNKNKLLITCFMKRTLMSLECCHVTPMASQSCLPIINMLQSD